MFSPVSSLNSLSIAFKACIGIIEASLTINIIIDWSIAACLEVGFTLHVVVSNIGTGSLNELCTVWPPYSKVVAIPVQAATPTYVYIKCIMIKYAQRINIAS